MERVLKVGRILERCQTTAVFVGAFFMMRRRLQGKECGRLAHGIDSCHRVGGAPCLLSGTRVVFVRGGLLGDVV